MGNDTWNGQFVTDALNIRHASDTPDSQCDVRKQEIFSELLGIALRKNEKRAHLLVSTVLGKHIPQQPCVIAFAASILSRSIYEYDTFGDSENFQCEHLEKLSEALRTSQRLRLLERTPLTGKKVTVFGYAETATSLGALVAEFLEADYIHSTRYPVAGVANYGSFDESHSHASVHHITPIDANILDDPERLIVLVDDEITTGNTLMNTIRLFHSQTQHETYYIATLTDLRTDDAVARFKDFEAELGIKVEVFSLISTQLSVPADSVAVAGPILEELKNKTEVSYSDGRGECVIRHYSSAPRNLSLGATFAELEKINLAGATTSKLLNPFASEKVLVLGVEEDMYFPLSIARNIEHRNLDTLVHFSSATRSPVVSYYDDGYAIKERIRYTLAGSEEVRYAYNIDDSYDRIILSFTNPADFDRHRELVEALTARTKVLEVLQAQNSIGTLGQPLTAPAFSSYRSEDVQWLLKDLSSAELEAPTEDREEAIQNGGAHYAESLPVEFVPSEEYTHLFKESLMTSKAKIAHAIGVVAEQAFELRDKTPVLVSLARAGVPVGVLMKRYLKAMKGYDAPHYAISIVRGKGIDYNALTYIANHHKSSNVIFVDGWTGKGAITKELTEALKHYEEDTGIVFNSELAVLADPGSSVSVYGTREDYLIPSACLNSTVSGLISRTVLHDDFIGKHDYHGAKFYKEFASDDMSNFFLDVITDEFEKLNISKVREEATELLISDTTPTWSGWSKIDELSTRYGIDNINLVKPGVGETTRVLLRRVPWKILVRPSDKDNLQHILMLAKERGVEVVEQADLPYACVGLIHPKFTKNSAGHDGEKM